MRPCELLIVAALLPEARTFAAALHLSFHPPLTFHPKISLALVGPRATRLASLAATLQPRAILLAGLGGGLLPSLRVGDVVVSREDGLIHGSDRLVTTPAQKAALFRETGAHAVDMESKVVRAYARERGIPCTVIRAISDAADEAIDPAVMTLVDGTGRPRVGRALGLMFRHPGKLSALLRLNRASKIALSNLAAAVVEHVNAPAR